MAPNTSVRKQQLWKTSVLEHYLLRCLILAFTRAAYDASKVDFEKRFLALYQKITCSSSFASKHGNTLRLAGLIWCFIIDSRIDLGLRSIAALPGLQEFCQCLQRYPRIKERWGSIILLCTRKCSETWAEKKPPTSGFTILKIAMENWEWACFRHYRESFRYWALRGDPCDPCVGRLHRMTRDVEYDRIEVALRNYNHTTEFLNCLPRAIAQTGLLIPSLEAFIMILLQPKNARWLTWWAPLIHMQTGFTVLEIYQTYIEKSRERAMFEGATLPLTRIPGTLLELRDIQHVVEAVQYERTVIGTWIEENRGS